MDRERAKELLPIIQAFAEGKKVEMALFDNDGAISEWADVHFPKWLDNHIYRIKPDPKYRPFEDAEECWEEMQKHVLSAQLLQCHLMKPLLLSR